MSYNICIPYVITYTYSNIWHQEQTKTNRMSSTSMNWYWWSHQWSAWWLRVHFSVCWYGYSGWPNCISCTSMFCWLLYISIKQVTYDTHNYTGKMHLKCNICSLHFTFDSYNIYIHNICNNLYIQYVTPHIKNRPKPTACLLRNGVDVFISEVLGDSELFVDVGILDGLIAPAALLCLLGLGLSACSLWTCVSFADKSSVECKCTSQP